MVSWVPAGRFARSASTMRLISSAMRMMFSPLRFVTDRLTEATPLRRDSVARSARSRRTLATSPRLTGSSAAGLSTMRGISSSELNSPGTRTW